MIDLRVSGYCKNCPEFDPDVKKETYEIPTREDCYREVVDTIITCKHETRCKEIYHRIKSEMETKNERIY